MKIYLWCWRYSENIYMTLGSLNKYIFNYTLLSIDHNGYMSNTDWQTADYNV